VRFSAPVETCTGVHPASYTMGTGSFPEVKRPGRGFDHPSPSTAEARPTWPVLSWTCHRSRIARSLYCCATCRCQHLGLHVQWPIFLSDFNQFGVSLQIFVKVHSVKCHGNTSSGKHVDTYVQTTRNNEANIRFSLFTRRRQLGREFECLYFNVCTCRTLYAGRNRLK